MKQIRRNLQFCKDSVGVDETIRFILVNSAVQMQIYMKARNAALKKHSTSYILGALKMQGFSVDLCEVGDEHVIKKVDDGAIPSVDISSISGVFKKGVPFSLMRWDFVEKFCRVGVECSAKIDVVKQFDDSIKDSGIKNGFSLYVQLGWMF